MKNTNDKAHAWFVHSTAIVPGWLLVKCDNTNQTGFVPNPTLEEWQAAFGASSKPYPWNDHSRVFMDRDLSQDAKALLQTMADMARAGDMEAAQGLRKRLDKLLGVL